MTRPDIVRITPPHRIGDGKLAMSHWVITVFRDPLRGHWVVDRVVRGRDLAEAVRCLRAPRRPY